MANKGWSRQELLVAFSIYCQTSFGKLHSRNPDIIRYAERIGRTPSALAMKLVNIASLDPAIVSTGRKGLSGASSADKAMWEEMQSNWEDFSFEATAEINRIAHNDVSEFFGSTDEVIDDYTGLDKDVRVRARVGQGFFRRSVLSAYDNKCCITGLAVPELLVASHIIPWRTDSSNRLNPRNGLSLSMLHDKAFDLGIITINEDMTVKVSDKELSQDDGFFKVAIKSYENKPIALPEKFAPLQEFLAFHRDNIFQG